MFDRSFTVFATNRKTQISSPVIIYKDNLQFYLQIVKHSVCIGCPRMLWDTLHKC